MGRKKSREDKNKNRSFLEKIAKQTKQMDKNLENFKFNICELFSNNCKTQEE